MFLLAARNNKSSCALVWMSFDIHQEANANLGVTESITGNRRYNQSISYFPPQLPMPWKLPYMFAKILFIFLENILYKDCILGIVCEINLRELLMKDFKQCSKIYMFIKHWCNLTEEFIIDYPLFYSLQGAKSTIT